jgi:hypothetical protein
MKVDLSKFDGLNPHRIVHDFMASLIKENFTNRSERFGYQKIYPIRECSVPDSTTGKFVTDIGTEYAFVKMTVLITPLRNKSITLPKQDIIDLVNSYFLPDRSIFLYNTRSLYKLIMFLREAYEYFVDSPSKQVAFLEETGYHLIDYQFIFHSVKIEFIYHISDDILDSIQQALINMDSINSAMSEIESLLMDAFGGIGSYLRKIMEQDE